MSEPSLPLLEWDAALGPVRRGLLGVRDGASPKWLPSIAAQRLGGLKREGVPEPVLELVDEVGRAIAAMPSSEANEVPALVATAWQGLSRLDALLGLPISRPLAPRVRRVAVVDQPEPRPASEVAVPEAPAPVGARPASPRAPTADVDGLDAILLEGPQRVAPPREMPARPMAAPPPRTFEAVHLDTRLEGALLPPAWVEALASAGIETVGDLLWTPPTGGEVLAPILGAGRLTGDGSTAFGGRVTARWVQLRPGQAPVFCARIVGAGPVTVRFDGLPPAAFGMLRCLLPIDGRVVLVGRQEGDAAVVVDGELAEDAKGYVRLATYGLAGISDRDLRWAVNWALQQLTPPREALPTVWTERFGALPLPDALRAVHHVGSEASIRRLALEEWVVATVGLGWARSAPNRERGLSHALQHHGVTLAWARHDLELGPAASLALEAVKRDLRRPQPMRRLLAAEPGAGRALVATWATLAVAETKAQVVWIVEDTTLAELRLGFLDPLLQETGLVGAVVVGQPNGATREAIRKGEIHVVVGTPDLLDGGLEFRRLGLVVASERTQPGATARALARPRPGPRPDLLVLGPAGMSWELLVACYADHDLTEWTEAHLGPVRVDVHTETERSVAYAGAAEAVSEGRQALVVFPLVHGHDVFDAREAVGVVGALADLFPGRRLALYHGAMSRAERAQVLDDARHRRVDVVVATTRIEEGLPLPRLGALVVEQADRFDRSRLDALRGLLRTTRDGGRLVLVSGEDGALDELRGFAAGEPPTLAVPAGERLVPSPMLRWAEPERDRAMWTALRDDVLGRLVEDPGLRRHVDLARLVRARWADLWPEDEDGGYPCPVGEAVGGDRRKRRRRRKK